MTLLDILNIHIHTLDKLDLIGLEIYTMYDLEEYIERHFSYYASNPHVAETDSKES